MDDSYINFNSLQTIAIFLITLFTLMEPPRVSASKWESVELHGSVLYNNNIVMKINFLVLLFFAVKTCTRVGKSKKCIAFSRNWIPQFQLFSSIPTASYSRKASTVQQQQPIRGRSSCFLLQKAIAYFMASWSSQLYVVSSICFQSSALKFLRVCSLVRIHYRKMKY